jgi:ParB/RepB/Spo0J family partition protein
MLTKLVSLEDIQTTTKNPRQMASADGIEDLATSIQEVGLLHPLHVKELSNSKYEILAGERRYHAVSTLGWTEVAVVIHAGDVPEDEIRHIENAARKNVHFMDLVDLVKRVRKEKKSDEATAKALGESVRRVKTLLRMSELPTAVTDHLRKGSLSFEHGQLLLDVPQEFHEELLQDWPATEWQGMQSINECRNDLDRLGRDLSNATWPLDQPIADDPACSTCPQNTGSEAMLFQLGDKATCVQAECFDRKLKWQINEAWKEIAEDQKKETLPEKEWSKLEKKFKYVRHHFPNCEYLNIREPLNSLIHGSSKAYIANVIDKSVPRWWIVQPNTAEVLLIALKEDVRASLRKKGLLETPDSEELEELDEFAEAELPDHIRQRREERKEAELLVQQNKEIMWNTIDNILLAVRARGLEHPQMTEVSKLLCLEWAKSQFNTDGVEEMFSHWGWELPATATDEKKVDLHAPRTKLLQALTQRAESEGCDAVWWSQMTMVLIILDMAPTVSRPELPDALTEIAKTLQIEVR